MKNKLIKALGLLALVFTLQILPAPVGAQCPMCKATAESNLKNGGTAGRGLNAGILYMLVVPYLLVGSIGYWWWRNRKKEEQQATEVTEEDL
ncbi:MAG: hypothetical protein JNL02_05520 [Saprospiraceae bacterium]|nr:hypothetical protein [Saprospiraceae bacterium]